MSLPHGLSEDVDPERGVITWTLTNDATRNAVSPDVLTFITKRTATLRGQTVVLTGAGERAFCSGFDLTALRESVASNTGSPDAPLIEATAAMSEANATFVAAINGVVVGAGVELAAACDFRYAVGSASFRVPAAALGVVYHARGLQRILSVFGPLHTRRMLLLGDTIAAEDAAHGGAVVVVARERLRSAVEEVAAKLAVGQPHSLAGNRSLLRALQTGPLTQSAITNHEALRADAYARIARKLKSTPTD